MRSLPRASVRLLPLVFAMCAGCAPHVPQIGYVTHIEAFCAPKEARPTSMASVLTSIGDDIADPFPRIAEVRRELKAQRGAIGYWDDQLLLEPNLAKAFGESGDFIRVDAIAIPTAPFMLPGDTSIPKRLIYLQVKDHDVKRWIGVTAYDVQDVCVEGAPQQ